MIPYVRGTVARQAHVGVPEGTFEEEYARNGFSGRYAHLYRRHAPVGWLSIEGPLRPRAYDVGESLARSTPDYLEARRALLGNDDVVLHSFAFDRAMGYAYRNADADEVLFIHSGNGKIHTDFGTLAYEPGDYLVLPRGTAYRMKPHAGTATRGLCFESFSEIRLPDRGMLGQHALFDPAVIRVPDPAEDPSYASCSGNCAAKAGTTAPREYELVIRRLGELTRVTYPFDPLDTAGWKGTLAPWQLNVRDIRPVSSDRYHLPPSAHTTFVAQNFVICTFLPRPLENGDAQAMKVPFYHSNIDFDEVLFYHQGQFFSRKGIGPGMLTFHPQGIHHGPQPGAEERTRDLEHTNEIAVMLDTRRPLRILAAAEPLERTDYWRSWQS